MDPKASIIALTATMATAILLIPIMATSATAISMVPTAISMAPTSTAASRDQQLLWLQLLSLSARHQ